MFVEIPKYRLLLASRHFTLFSAYFRMGHYNPSIGLRQSSSTCVTAVLICDISSNPVVVLDGAKIWSLGDPSTEIKEQKNVQVERIKAYSRVT
jgi:hypothetical protein